MTAQISLKKRILRLVIFVALIIIVSAILNFLTFSPTEYHRLQNHDLYSNRSYELIAFGSSDCRANFDPRVIKEEFGINSFNYGGSATTYFSGGVESSFDNAMTVQRPQIVLFYVPYDLFSIPEEEMSNESESIFIHSTLEMGNPFAKLKYILRASKNTGAIERLFPWVSLRKEAEIIDNITKKCEKEYWTYNIEWRNNLKPSMPYVGDGFVPYSKGGMAEVDIDYLLNQVEDDLEFGEETGYDLAKLLKKCRKKGIVAYVIMQPKFVRGITYRDYLTSQRIKEIAKLNEAIFIDVNMVKKEEFRICASDWNSSTHLSISGAEKYTRELCKIIKDENSVELYQNYDEFLNSVLED